MCYSITTHNAYFSVLIYLFPTDREPIHIAHGFNTRELATTYGKEYIAE